MFFQLLGGRSEVSGKFGAGPPHNGRFGYKELRRDVLEHPRLQHSRLETGFTLHSEGTKRCMEDRSNCGNGEKCLLTSILFQTVASPGRWSLSKVPGRTVIILCLSLPCAQLGPSRTASGSPGKLPLQAHLTEAEDW